MRTRRSIVTAALVLTLTASSVSAATRDNRPSQRADRPSIVAVVKRVIDKIIRAFPGPSVPIPETQPAE